MNQINIKPSRYITGSLLETIVTGQPARIKTHEGIVVTSEVEHSIVYPDGRIYIETARTKYWLDN